MKRSRRSCTFLHSAAKRTCVPPRRHAYRGDEVAVQMSLIGEAGLERDVADRAARLQQTPSESDPLRELIAVRGRAEGFTEQTQDTKPRDARRRSEVLERHVAR